MTCCLMEHEANRYLRHWHYHAGKFARSRFDLKESPDLKSGRVFEVRGNESEGTSAWIRSTAQIRLRLINRKLIGVGRTSNV